jgi:hypothetical protein
MPLYWTGDGHARLWPTRREHRHVCGCGDYFVCSRRDGCQPDPWTCPNCLDDQRDDYLNALSPATEQETRS